MVASRNPRKVFCTVVRVPTAGQQAAHRLNRPSDLLPWADPYIARLVQNLQEEVRHERAATRHSWDLNSPIHADLEPPSPTSEPDWDWQEDPRWSFSDDTPS